MKLSQETAPWTHEYSRWLARTCSDLHFRRVRVSILMDFRALNPHYNIWCAHNTVYWYSYWTKCFALSVGDILVRATARLYNLIEAKSLTCPSRYSKHVGTIPVVSALYSQSYMIVLFSCKPLPVIIYMHFAQRRRRRRRLSYINWAWADPILVAKWGKAF